MNAGKIIYQNKKLDENQPYISQGSGIGIDDTDHFHLICPDCLLVMPVSLIKYFAKSKVLHIFAVCEKCGFSTQRKIYLERTDPIAISAIVNKEVVLMQRNIRIKYKIDPETREEFNVE